MPAVPTRLRRAAELFALDGDERVLELGCGPGVLAEHVLEQHPAVRYVALDRSPVAVERALRRNAAAARDGRLVVRTGAVEQAGALLAADAPFDAVVAVNVNLFWTRDARAECAALTGLLRPGGRCWLVYETPGGDPGARLLGPLLASLDVPGLDGSADGAPVVVRDDVLAVGARRHVRPEDPPTLA